MRDSSNGKPGGQGGNRTPTVERRLIYSQRSSPPAQPTHEISRRVVRRRPSFEYIGRYRASQALEPRVGVEPTTVGLQNRCSAIELPRRPPSVWHRRQSVSDVG